MDVSKGEVVLVAGLGVAAVVAFAWFHGKETAATPAQTGTTAATADSQANQGYDSNLLGYDPNFPVNTYDSADDVSKGVNLDLSLSYPLVNTIVQNVIPPVKAWTPPDGFYTTNNGYAQCGNGCNSSNVDSFAAEAQAMQSAYEATIAAIASRPSPTYLPDIVLSPIQVIASKVKSYFTNEPSAQTSVPTYTGGGVYSGSITVSTSTRRSGFSASGGFY